MRTVAIVKYLFTVLGIGMLVGSVFVYQHTRAFVAVAAKAQGTVVDLARSSSSSSSTSNSYTYAPVVQFQDRNGQKIEFTSTTGSNPPSYSRGERVEVLYDPAHPQDAQINGTFSLWGGVIILAALGSIFFLIGGGIMMFGVMSSRRKEYLTRQGEPIETEFQEVALNKGLTVNGRNPFQILTQWQNPATSEIHIFKSDNIWFNPAEYVKDKKIRVYIARGNPKKYYVDISFLPKLAK